MSELAELNLIAGKRAKDVHGVRLSAQVFRGWCGAIAIRTLGRAGTSSSSRWSCRRAECEFLTGELVIAEQRLATVRARAANAVEQRACHLLAGGTVYRSWTGPSGQSRCVSTVFGIWASTGRRIPRDEEAQAEYERILSLLGSREIEELIELALDERSGVSCDT